MLLFCQSVVNLLPQPHGNCSDEGLRLNAYTQIYPVRYSREVSRLCIGINVHHSQTEKITLQSTFENVSFHQRTWLDFEAKIITWCQKNLALVS